MKMLSIDYNGVEGLLNSLSRLSFEKGDMILDTNKPKPNATIRREQFLKGKKVVIEEAII